MNMDVLSGDMVLGAKRYGWWSWNSELNVGENFTSTENYIGWRFLHRVVNLANFVVDGQGGNDVVPETDAAKALMGQAKAARAWAYFNLVHLYVDDSSYVDGLSQSQLLDEITLQTRIELWGEGKSYLALKRRKGTVVLPWNHLDFPGRQILHNSDLITLELPEAEILYNPLINEHN